MNKKEATALIPSAGKIMQTFLNHLWKSVRLTWRIIVKPTICFCAASIWFFLRSVFWLIAKTYIFAEEHIFVPLSQCFRDACSRAVLKKLPPRFVCVCRAIWQTIRSFFGTVVGRPARWFWKRIVLPLDTYWKRHESWRMEQRIGIVGEGPLGFRLSVARRIAYVCVGYMIVAVSIAGVVSLLDNSSCFHRPSRHLRKTDYFTHLSKNYADGQRFQHEQDVSNHQSQMVDMTGWPQWKKDCWSRDNPRAVCGSRLDISLLPQWQRDIWDDPKRRERYENWSHASMVGMEEAIKLRMAREQQALIERSALVKRSHELWENRLQEGRARRQQLHERQQQAQQQVQRQTVPKQYYPCPTCHGRGTSPPPNANMPCWMCHGLGKLER